MSACKFVTEPEELAVLAGVFHDAWQHVAPMDAPFESAHREWLARLILGLRRSGHSGDITLLAIEQFMATAPLAERAGIGAERVSSPRGVAN